MSKTLRVFWGIKIDPADQERLKPLLESLELGFANEQPRWIKPEYWHITLAFLGSMSHLDIEGMMQVVGQLLEQQSSFPLPISKIALFPGQHARILAGHMELTAPLNDLYKRLKINLELLGLPVEQRAYLPHLTFAKFKHRITSPLELPCKDLKLTANKLVLYESQSTDEGTAYVPIKEWSLT